jgi:hypothetical protein
LKRVQSDDPKAVHEETDDEVVADNLPLFADCHFEMPMDYEYDPWDDTKIQRIFAPMKDGHPIDAIARRIDKFMEARKSVEGCKSLIIGGDPHDNCTELDKIMLQYKAFYLISALRFALSYHPKKHGQNAVKKPVQSAVH